MKLSLKFLYTSVVNLVVVTGFSILPAIAQTVGPISPQHGFPQWYQDSQGLRLYLCLDANNPLCVAAPRPNPNQPISFPNNFPDEAFWWTAEAEMAAPNGGRARLVLATEAAFLDDLPAPEEQIVFNRIRIRVDNLPVGRYKVTHPYGQDFFQVTTVEQRNINDTEDIGCLCGPPCEFTSIFESRIGPRPWLTWDSSPPAAPAGYIGNPNILHRVTGSPGGTNYFRIERVDNNGNVVQRIGQTNLFSVSGKKLP